MGKWLRRRRAATAVEYALVLFLIGMGITAGVVATGTNVEQAFCIASDRIAGTETCIAPGNNGGTPTPPGGGSGGGGDDGGGGGDDDPTPVAGRYAYGYTIDCESTEASCWRVGSGSLPAGPDAANAAQCAGAQDAEAIALATGRGLLAASGLSGSQALEQCSADSSVFGWVARCTDATVAFDCRGVVRDRPGVTFAAAPGACTAFAPEAGDAALLSGAGLIPHAERDGYDASWCEGASHAYGWSVSCEYDYVGCTRYSRDENGIDGLWESAPDSMCAVAATPAELTLLQGTGLLPPGTGMLPSDAMAQCENPDTIYGLTGYCGPLDGAWDTGFDCTGTLVDQPGSGFHVPMERCDAYTPRPEDSAALTAANLIPVTGRADFEASCVPAVAYGYDLQCIDLPELGMTPSASCRELRTRDNERYIVEDPADTAACQAPQDVGATAALTAAGLIPGGPGVTPEASLQACGNRGVTYVWNYSCTGVGAADFTCLGLDTTQPQQPPVPTDAASCAGYSTQPGDAAFIGLLQSMVADDSGFLTHAEYTAFDVGMACQGPSIHGINLDCAGGYAECVRLVQDSNGNWERWWAEDSACESTPLPEHVSLLEQEGLIPGGPGGVSEAFASCPSTITTYGWQVSCANNMATCRGLFYEDGNSEWFNATEADCAQPVDSMAATFIRAQGWIPGGPGTTAASMLGQCSGTVGFAYGRSCNANGWSARANTCYRVTEELNGYNWASLGDTASCQTDQSATVLTFLDEYSYDFQPGRNGFTSAMAYAAAGCSATVGYGYRVNCEADTAECVAVSSAGGAPTVVAEGQCGTSQSGTAQTLVSDAGYIVGGPGVTTASALEMCEPEPGRIYGWSANCGTDFDGNPFIGEPECWALEDGNANSGWYQSDNWRCNAFAASTDQLAQLNARGLMNPAQLADYDYETCSPPWVEASWKMVPLDGPYCQTETLVYDMERWACVRGEREITDDPQEACGPRPDADAPFTIEVGSCLGFWSSMEFGWVGHWMSDPNGNGSTFTTLELSQQWWEGTNSRMGSQYVSPKASDEVLQIANDYCVQQNADACSLYRDDFTNWQTWVFAFHGDVVLNPVSFAANPGGGGYAGASDRFDYRQTGESNIPYEQMWSPPSNEGPH